MYVVVLCGTLIVLRSTSTYPLSLLGPWHKSTFIIREIANPLGFLLVTYSVMGKHDGFNR